MSGDLPGSGPVAVAADVEQAMRSWVSDGDDAWAASAVEALRGYLDGRPS